MVYRDILKSYNTLSNHAYKRTPYHPWYKQTVSYKSEVIKNTKRSFTSFGQLQQDKTKENYVFRQANCSMLVPPTRYASSQSQKDKQAPSKLKLFGGAIVVGITVGTVYAYLKERKKLNQLFSDKLALKQIGNTTADSSVNATKDQYLLKESPPVFTPARRIRNPADTTGLKLTLFQYQTCPFCCKARAFLDYFGLNYDVIEVNSVMRTQVKWSAYKKVPILVVETPEGESIQLVDSSMIISTLYSFLLDKSKGVLETASCYPRISSLDIDGKEKEEISNKYFLMFNEGDTGRKKEDITQERKWRKWVDETFVHTLSPNVYRTPSESLQAFRWFNEIGGWEKHFSAWERFVVVYIGSAAMWIISKRLKKRHGLKPDVRQSLYDETNVWLKAVKARGGKFLGGNKPNLADLSVYGALSAIEGCEAFLDLCANTKVKSWYDDVQKSVENSEGQIILSKT